jgi:hypothetical protein
MEQERTATAKWRGDEAKLLRNDLGRLFDAAQGGPTLLDGSHDLVACSDSGIIGFHGYGCGTCEM